jgi:hypothetical protein
MDGAEIVTMELPYGQDVLWFAEFNIVALSPRLDAEGRARALDELQRRWRQATLPPSFSAA